MCLRGGRKLEPRENPYRHEGKMRNDKQMVIWAGTTWRPRELLCHCFLFIYLFCFIICFNQITFNTAPNAACLAVFLFNRFIHFMKHFTYNKEPKIGWETYSVVIILLCLENGRCEHQYSIQSLGLESNNNRNIALLSRNRDPFYSLNQ